LAASSQHGPSSSPSTARGEPIDNVGDVYRTANKSVAASPLSSDVFVAGSLAAKEICLLRRCSSSASDSGPSEVALLVLFQAQARFQSFFSSANSVLRQVDLLKSQNYKLSSLLISIDVAL